MRMPSLDAARARSAGDHEDQRAAFDQHWNSSTRPVGAIPVEENRQFDDDKENWSVMLAQSRINRSP